MATVKLSKRTSHSEKGIRHGDLSTTEGTTLCLNSKNESRKIILSSSRLETYNGSYAKTNSNV
jgi:hypothetical protein